MKNNEFALDTSVFLWYITNDKRLAENHSNEIQSERNNVYLSVVSIRECLIKQQIGKLSLLEPIAEYLITQRDQHQISSLSLEENSLTYLGDLPHIHKDPFDRILICQAKDNNCTLVT